MRSLIPSNPRKAEVWPYLGLLGVLYGADHWINSSRVIIGVPLPFVGGFVYALFLCSVIGIALYYGLRENGARTVAFGVLGLIILNAQGLDPFVLLEGTWLGRNWLPIIVLPEISITVAIIVVAYMRSKILGAEGGIKYASMKIIPLRTIALAVASELIIFYYAFLSWLSIDSEDGNDSTIKFSYWGHEGFRTTVFVFFAISLIDIPITHVIVGLWSSKAAWIISVVGVYGSIWILAFFNSCQRRPITFDGKALILRRGMLPDNTLSIEDIEMVRSANAADLGKISGRLSFYAKPGTPNILIKLRSPMDIELMMGIRKKASELLLAVDDPHEFIKVLSPPSSIS